MEVNEISNDTKKSMKTRIITGIIMALVGIPCLILGDWFYLALVLMIVCIGVWEMMKVTGKKYPWMVYVIVYITTLSFVFWTFFQKGNDVQNSVAEFNMETGHFIMSDIRLSSMAAGVSIASLFLVAICTEKIDINDVFYLFGMSLFIGFSAQAALFLRYCPAVLTEGTGYTYPNNFITVVLLVYVIFGAILNDICAYFVGVLFGKHKMNKRVSPKKTWEGFFGGLLLETLISTGLVFLLELVFGVPVLKGIIDVEHWYYVVLFSICLGLASVLGDLMFSLIKRHYNIKDYGNIFPGHGGVLDRFDSVLMTAMLAAIFITFIYYNPIFGVIY